MRAREVGVVDWSKWEDVDRFEGLQMGREVCVAKGWFKMRQRHFKQDDRVATVP